MKYLVIGVYVDNGYQRFAEWVNAESPEAAESLVGSEGDLVVAGVLSEEGEIVA